MNPPVAGLDGITVAFLYVGAVSRIPRIIVASVRAAMPHARIVQMTDYLTMEVNGVDELIRKKWDQKFLMPYRLLHLREFPAVNVIFLDADVEVQKDLSRLFKDEFDIALTFRDETDPSLRLTPLAHKLMPFNAGVMLSRASGMEFWAEAHRLCLGMSEKNRDWLGDQLAIKEVAGTTKLKVKQYPCAKFNYSPAFLN